MHFNSYKKFQISTGKEERPFHTSHRSPYCYPISEIPNKYLKLDFNA